MSAEWVTRSFNIHDLVHVRVETRLETKLQQVMCHLAEFEETADLGRMPDVVVEDYSEAPNLEDATVIADHYFCAKGSLDIPSHRIRFDLVGAPIRVYCDRLLLPISVLIQLVLLRKGHSFIHAAGVEFNRRHYLFPALGGVGKTTLVAAVVFAGRKLYDDDMTIVNENEMLSYPQDFSVYPYHVPLLGLNDRSIAQAFKRTAILNRITNVLERYDSRPAKLARFALNSLKVPCVNVSPRQIFGGQCFAKRGVIDEVYYLSRTTSDSRDSAINRIDPKVLAEVCTNVLLHEWHKSMRYLYVYSALSSFSMESLYISTRTTLERLFRSRPCYLMEIPSSMTNVEYQQEIIQYLRKGSEV